MSWAKHCCLLKIEGSYQLAAEDTPLCAPWSDNSPLCSAIGFPHLPDLSAPTRTVLHSLAWQRTAVSLPKLSRWRGRRASAAHLDKAARDPDMRSVVEKHFIDPMFETSLEHQVGLCCKVVVLLLFFVSNYFYLEKLHACFFRHGSHAERVLSPHKWNCTIWIFHNVQEIVSFLLRIHSSGRMSQSWDKRPWEDGVLLNIAGLHRWRLVDVAAAMLIQNIPFIKRINSILCPERFIDSCNFYATGSTNGF